MNKNVLRTLKFAALLLPLVLVFIFSQEFLFDYRNYDTMRIEQFYEEEEDSLDVVFLGASEIYAGYCPGYAYDRYGFTSYMYVMDSNQGSLYLSQLKEILNHQEPEILFVDLYGFLRAEDAPLFDETRLRIFVENIPLSANKVQTIMQFPCEQKLSYFFPLIMYHGNPAIAHGRLDGVYHALTKQEQPSSLKGALTRTMIYNGIGDPGEEFDPATYTLTDHSKAYLIEFLDYCKNNNLNNVVFTNFPRNLADDTNHSLLFLLEQVEPIVLEYGYPVWNLHDEVDAIGIDESHDYYNEHHLNIYGQLKITDYIGSKVIADYGLTPRAQSEANKAEWELCASNTEAYIQMAKEVLQIGTDMVIFEGETRWKYRK